jgi:hypothetical protein
MQYIAFDSHKHYTQACVENTAGSLIREARITHERGAMREFLTHCEPGSSVAVETVGNWYWIVDEIESARCVPKLVHAHKAKLMMGMMNKTAKLAAQRLNRLQRRHVARSLDSPSCAAGSTRVAPHADGPRAAAYPAQESHPCHIDQVCPGAAPCQ